MARSVADLPGPRGLPVLGNAHQLRVSRMHVILEKWLQRHGPMYRIGMGPTPVVVVGDREAIGIALRKRPAGFRRWTMMAEVINEIGVDGVFTAEGEVWRRQRRLSVTALNTDHLHRFYDVIARSAERLHGQLTPPAASGEPIDIHPLFQSYTVDVTSALAFGQDINTLEGVDSGLQQHIDRLFDMTARRMNTPFPYWRRIKLPADRALDRSMAVLNDAVANFIAAGRKRLADEPDRAPENFLEGMLAGPDSYTDAEIVGNMLTMLVAGEDTTSHSLGWAAWYLAIRPDVQQRVAAEAAAVFTGSVAPSYDQAMRLPYAEAVVREAIRLRSPASVIFLEAVDDTDLGGVAIPAGTRLILLTREVALREESYVRALEFDPDRWLADGGADAKDYLAFGAGPRVCPGRNLAHLEAKAALAMLAGAFEISLDPDAPPVYEEFGFTTGPSAVPVRLRTRERVA
jgi:cytochrome P450